MRVIRNDPDLTLIDYTMKFILIHQKTLVDFVSTAYEWELRYIDNLSNSIPPPPKYNTSVPCWLRKLIAYWYEGIIFVYNYLAMHLPTFEI